MFFSHCDSQRGIKVNVKFLSCASHFFISGLAP